MDLKVARGGAADQLARRLMDMIETGELAVGDRLPTERELVTLSGVSRNTVREALASLELRGLVTRRPGSGSVVAMVPRPDVAASLRGVMPPDRRVLKEIMDLRAVVEPPVAERAALRANEAEAGELAEITQAAARELARDEPSTRRLVELDVAFHTQVAHLAQNQMVVQLLKVVNDWIRPSRDEALQTHERQRRSQRGHQRIVDAIRAREPEAARRAMAEHIVDIETIIAAHHDSV